MILVPVITNNTDFNTNKGIIMSSQHTTNAIHDEELTLRSGNEMKRVLKVAGFSQREIADHINYSRSYVNAVCNGTSELTLRVIEGVKECLGTTLYALAIKRVRLQEALKRQEDEERKRLEAIAHAEEEEQARNHDAERRRAAIEKVQKDLELEGDL
jgi:transcriptional regulator with XRE-family HTH domain